jgi:hypothetical protein
MVLGMLSAVLALAVGVGEGADTLERHSFAPLVHAALFAAAAGVLGVLTGSVTRLLAREADAAEGHRGLLLRSQVAGPSARWTIWLSAVAVCCATGYFVGEVDAPTGATHAPLTVLLVIVAVGLAGLSPWLTALARGHRAGVLPWRAHDAGRVVREEDDLIGAIARLSPPLLLALAVVAAMCVATLAVAVVDPWRLWGGVGVIGLFVAALLAAPGLLRAPGALLEPRWLDRGYAAQLRLVTRLRPRVRGLHRVLVAFEVATLGVGLGLVFSGQHRFVGFAAKLLLDAAVAGGIVSVFARVLWLWSPVPPSGPPVLTDVLLGRERQLLAAAGVALVIGAVSSLVAVLSA